MRHCCAFADCRYDDAAILLAAADYCYAPAATARRLPMPPDDYATPLIADIFRPSAAEAGPLILLMTLIFFAAIRCRHCCCCLRCHMPLLCQEATPPLPMPYAAFLPLRRRCRCVYFLMFHAIAAAPYAADDASFDADILAARLRRLLSFTMAIDAAATPRLCRCQRWRSSLMLFCLCFRCCC